MGERRFQALLQDGFEIVSAELVGGEWQLAVQTTATMIGCAGPYPKLQAALAAAKGS
jgi:hypothetical protein